MPHLLLVEDDLTFSTLLSTWLGKKGFQVTTASTVQAAIKRLLHEEEPTQLVLSDLRLPDEDGLRLLQWLREQGRQEPFIVMTSYAEVQNAVAAMKLGATDYISKPVQPDILLEKYRRHSRRLRQALLPRLSLLNGNKRARPGQQLFLLRLPFRWTRQGKEETSVVHRRLRHRLQELKEVRLLHENSTDWLPW